MQAYERRGAEMRDIYGSALDIYMRVCVCVCSDD